MASIKISQLNQLTKITSDDFFPVVDSGSLTTFHVPTSVLGAWFNDSGSVLSASWASRSINSETASLANSYKEHYRFTKPIDPVTDSTTYMASYFSVLHPYQLLVGLNVWGTHCSTGKTYILTVPYEGAGSSFPWQTAMPIVASEAYYSQSINKLSDFDLEISKSTNEILVFRIRPWINTAGVRPTASLTILNLLGWTGSVVNEINGSETTTGPYTIYRHSFVQQSAYLLSVSGSMCVQNGITSSLLCGTASWAISSSNAITSSYAVTSSYLITTGPNIPDSASYARSSSIAATASYCSMSLSSSYSLTASFLTSKVTASYALTASYVIGTSREYSVKSVFKQSDEIGQSPQTHDFFCWIDQMDRVVSIGRTYQGETGVGESGDVHVTDPTFVVYKFAPAADVSPSQLYAIGRNLWIIMNDGTVHATGYNGYGMVGDNSTTDRNVMVTMSLTSLSAGEKITKLRPASSFNSVRAIGGSMALISNLDNVYLNGIIRTYADLATHRYLYPMICNSASLSANCSDAMVFEPAYPTWYFLRKSDGNVIGCGYNGTYQLGTGDTTYKEPSVLSDWVTVFAPGGGEKVIKMCGSSGTVYGGAAYACYAMFLTDGGKLYSVGVNSVGNCGFDPLTTPYVTTTTQITTTLGAVTVVSASAGGSYGYWTSTAIDSNGNLYTWGNNVSGQLGYTTGLGYSFTPTIPTGLSGITFKKSVVQNNACPSILALSTTGRVWAAGTNTNGELGFGDTTNRSTFEEIPYPANIRGHIVDIGIFGYGGEAGSVPNHESYWLLTDSGDLYVAGNNYAGQCGKWAWDPVHAFIRVNRP